MNDEDLPPFQWIFDIECFHYLSKVYIKEFCGYCIQTGESILYHVRTPANIMITMDPMHVTVFAVQSHRHGFSISDGDMTLDEFYDKLNQKVAKDCTIYTTSRLAEQFFKRQSKHYYPEVVYLGNMLPHNYNRVMIPLPDKACLKKHSEVHCAQRKAYELAKFLTPSFVPYLQCSLIRRQCANYSTVDSEHVKYGQHYFKPPLYQSLKSVDLVRDAVNQESAVSDVKDCEYSLEG